MPAKLSIPQIYPFQNRLFAMASVPRFPLDLKNNTCPCGQVLSSDCFLICSADVAQRIGQAAVDLDFKVQVIARGITGGTDIGDDLTGADIITG